MSDNFPTKDLKVALFPMPITWGVKAANIDTLLEAMPQIYPQIDLLILPETFSTGFPSGMGKEEVRKLAERNTGKTIDLVKALAKEYGMGICGSYVAETGGLLFNRAFFIEPGGGEFFADKKHLFTMAGEDKVFRAGDSRLNVRFRGWNISMVICYDVRFPVWCRNSTDPYQLLIAVANWPQQRIDAWEQLLRARAIENQAYVCGVDCLGTDPQGNIYNGSSQALDFLGKDTGVRCEIDLKWRSGDTEYVKAPIIYANLEAAKLDRFRTKFAAWRDADPCYIPS